jgi:hypothetical protein
MWQFVSLIGPIKSRPHFLSGFYGKVVINFAQLHVAKVHEH